MRARVSEKTEASVKDGVLMVRMSKRQPRPLPKTHKAEVK